MTTEAERLAGALDIVWLEGLATPAAAMIRSQAAEIERLKSTPPDQREDLRCVIADLIRQCQESDALLREALDVIKSECGFFGGSNNYDPRAIVDAIRQHLGETHGN